MKVIQVKIFTLYMIKSKFRRDGIQEVFAPRDAFGAKPGILSWFKASPPAGGREDFNVTHRSQRFPRSDNDEMWRLSKK